ncbi:glutamate--cysteine ligase [Marinitenerispora sediminis]|uniref:Putative glutamate--cysteine ligase 2 n=1 Tax=Marinitenerispora sediminis TaxID=1931232 RepID=A0A368T433_9ACTN|nr:glutamate--cysteine ligase [Marinitenerispora sediminis]RCV49663.1 glutamate--cysteine ligase [Marinitenerispora sediminis]RCV53196.1 glutamate--cysteine ligase [Marinitenerispora sediminis]RCV57314.1 glutamate--cysteine ligase [Marinitenerispora sediminis]
MAIEFNASDHATLGVEWELQLVDVGTRHLRQEAQQVLAELPDLSETSDRPPLRHELMQCTIEVVTGVCETVEEAKADLGENIRRMRQVMDPRGAALMCAGTHPMDDWRDQTLSPVQRYGELIDQMQWLGRRILTFGVHVHVGIRSREKAVPIVNALAHYLPHFLALTASSPFWSGHDTGLASSRSVVFGALPTAGPPPHLKDWASFEEYMETLLRAGTISSIKEVWWDVRPHPDYGTVEIRMFDGIPTMREVGMAAALSQSLVHMFDQQLDRGYQLPSPPSWVVNDNKWRATRYGLDARVITDERGGTVPLRDDLYELVRELEPVAKRLGCAEDLDVISDILRNGASYERQRAIIDQGGTLNDVVDALAAEFRAGTPGAPPAGTARGEATTDDNGATDAGAGGEGAGREHTSRKRGPSHAGA